MIEFFIGAGYLVILIGWRRYWARWEPGVCWDLARFEWME